MKMRSKKLCLAVCVALVGAGFLYFHASNIFAIRYDVNGDVKEEIKQETKEEDTRPKVTHIETPPAVKAIYMSQCVSGTPSFRNQLVELIDSTELNSVIIDIKDFSGKLGFLAQSPRLVGSISDECRASDAREFIQTLHDKGIYVIGRITVFQDPYYTSLHPEAAVQSISSGGVWKDYKGLSFVDVGYQPFWDYIIEISKEAYDVGFDELNYDYIRYPSDGNMKDVSYAHSGTRQRADALEVFFSYLYENLKDTDIVLSADLFGYTTTNVDDLGIGQLLERTLPYFHYVMPMVYPSHYNSGFIGIEKPATQPYEVIKYSMDSAVRRANKIDLASESNSTSTDVIILKDIAEKGHGNISKDQLRPWLQDFDLGATYTPEMVRAQIQATYDTGLTSWALWDAGNTYTRAALLSDIE